MFLLGLTGSIGMGKSETAKMFLRFGVPVYDSDLAVHALYEKGGAAVAPIGAVFPDAIKADAVDRAALSRFVVGNAEAMKRLEKIVHPLVGAAQVAFLKSEAAKGTRIVVLDIPLLFETGGEARVDAVVVVTAPAEIQRQRVLARPGMTLEKFEAILAKQLSDGEKRRRADFVIETDKGLDYAMKEVRRVLAAVATRAGTKFLARID